MDPQISQPDFINNLIQCAQNLGIESGTEAHYQEHAEYYWKNKMQFISVINKKIPDDKLRIIFMTHIQKVGKENVNVNEIMNVIPEPQTKIVPTLRYTVHVAM